MTYETQNSEQWRFIDVLSLAARAIWSPLSSDVVIYGPFLTTYVYTRLSSDMRDVQKNLRTIVPRLHPLTARIDKCPANNHQSNYLCTGDDWLNHKPLFNRRWWIACCTLVVLIQNIIDNRVLGCLSVSSAYCLVPFIIRGHSLFMALDVTPRPYCTKLTLKVETDACFIIDSDNEARLWIWIIRL